MGLKKKNLILGFLAFLFLDCLLLSLAAPRPRVHYYDFVLQEANFTKLCSTKSILTVNGSFPGPEVRVQRGDRVFVNVHNKGSYGVTVHWHGVKQPRNPWSDGPEYVTQCPIQPNTSFTYEVILSDEIGTIWWHAHSDWSRATVHGAFVIQPAPGETYPFIAPDGDHTIILGTWYPGDLKAISDRIASTGTAPAASAGYTINGHAGDTYKCATDTIFRLQVDYDSTHLLRIINAALNEAQFFGIANHVLTVVAQDGAYAKRLTTDYILISPGQTIDVLVTANQNIGRYYIAMRPFYDGAGPLNGNFTTALLEYTNYGSDEVTLALPPLPAQNNATAAINFVSKIKSLNIRGYRVKVPKRIDKRMYMTVSTNQLPCTGSTCATVTKQAASLNNVSFVAPHVDILLAYYNRSINGVASLDFPQFPVNFYNFTGNLTGFPVMTAQGTRAIVLNYGEAVEIVFQATTMGAGGAHPMHLHGYSFYLVGMGSGNFNNVTHPKTYNLYDPPEINTVTLPGRGWTAIRFFANNPGVWFMHCHLERHSSWGMATVLIVKNGKTRQTSMLPPPPYKMPSCS